MFIHPGCYRENIRIENNILRGKMNFIDKNLIRSFTYFNTSLQSVGLASFITGDVYGWGYLMSGAVLTTLPVIAAYIYLQKYMVEGLTAGSVKG